MNVYNETSILAALDRQREALRREVERLPECTGIPEMLGRAARLMRERALAANTDDERRPYGDDRLDPVPESGWGKLVYGYLGGAIGEHCESLHPAVALAVADWLEIGSNPHACVDLAPMVAVARAYLGEPDSGSSAVSGKVTAAQACQAETRSWDHFTPEQMDSYWIRCTLHGPHSQHKDEHTGLTWADSPAVDRG